MHVSAATADRVVVTHDIFSDESIINAHRFDGEMREAAPAVWVERYKTWFIGRHKDVQQVYADWKTFSSSANPFSSDASIAVPILVGDDPPKHTKAKTAISPVFGPATMRTASETFSKVAAEAVDEILDQGEFDGAKLASRFILKAFPDLLGLPEEGREHLVDVGQAVLNSFGTKNERTLKALEKAGPGFAWVESECTKEKVKPGGLADSIYALVETGKVSDEEAGLLVRTVLFAGFDTTMLSLGNCLALLAGNSQNWCRIKDPAVRKTAFEEGLRMLPPGRYSNRVAKVDTDFHGVSIKAGDQVALGLAAAGRDPRKWERPDEFDLDRKATGHVSFGFGIHSCIGQMLARLEAESLLAAMIERIETLELAGEPVTLMNNVTTGYGSVPLRIRAR